MVTEGSQVAPGVAARTPRSCDATPAPCSGPERHRTMTTNQKADWTAGKWRLCPWPGGCADPRAAAWTFIEPKTEWRKPLERWLPGYHWPDDPDRAAMERVLMAAPFNLRPADFNAMTLPIDRVVAWMDSVSVVRSTDTNAPTLISATVAEGRYHVNAETIGEAVRNRELADYRPAGHAKNAPHRVDEREVANRWPKRTVPM